MDRKKTEFEPEEEEAKEKNRSNSHKQQEKHLYSCSLPLQVFSSGIKQQQQ